MGAAMRVAILALLQPMASHAGGDHGGHDSAPTPSPSSHTVKWILPGVHTHGGGEETSHEMAVEIGVGKKLSVNVDDDVTFQWDSMHSLTEMAGETQLNDCDFTGATDLVDAKATATYTLPTDVAKTFYLSCNVYG